MIESQTPIPTYPMDSSSAAANDPPPRRSRIVKWLIGAAVVVALGFFVLAGSCLYIGLMAPDTKVLSGRQVPARYVGQVRELGVLEPDEQIRYFYSDALLNIEEGFYLITDRKLVVYCRAYEEPAVLVPLSSVAAVEADFSDSWIDDSIITVTLTDGTDVAFPASNEGGGDHRMYDALKKHVPSSDDP